LQPNGFQDRRNRPLCHPSAMVAKLAGLPFQVKPKPAPFPIGCVSCGCQTMDIPLGNDAKNNALIFI
jgi:hypothetical protein